MYDDDVEIKLGPGYEGTDPADLSAEYESLSDGTDRSPTATTFRALGNGNFNAHIEGLDEAWGKVYARFILAGEEDNPRTTTIAPPIVVSGGTGGTAPTAQQVAAAVIALFGSVGSVAAGSSATQVKVAGLAASALNFYKNQYLVPQSGSLDGATPVLVTASSAPVSGVITLTVSPALPSVPAEGVQVFLTGKGA